MLVLDHDFRVLDANDAARQVFADVDLAGQPVTKLLDNVELTEMLECTCADQTCPPEVQFTYNHHIYRARCELCATGGSDYDYIGLTLQDVTQLARLNRARREMVANISHELRAPISAIRLLHDTINRPGTGKKQRFSILRKIGRQLDNLQRIIDDMHDLSMIESGQAIMRLVATPVNPLVDEALEHMEEQIRRRKLRVRVRTTDTLFALVDETQIARVLANLVDNAVKFTPKRGQVQITFQVYPEDDEFVQGCICDSGPGIPFEERERIFERFYQLDQARRIGRGSGLGLSIAKHIITAHNGQIWVEDSPLGGACICFTLMNATPQADKGKDQPFDDFDQAGS
ncbi:MAG: PAS domain-containing sensor histidine kinase [Anaerolineae bacterium]|nr:PAS domain-containing sensor histidine kinase [Anaerolineae bacterium]